MTTVAEPVSPLTREPPFAAERFPPAVPGPKVVQNARLAYDPIGFLDGQRRRLGPVFTLRILPYRSGLICVTDAALSREVLTDQDRFVGGDAAYLLEPIVGAHSLILTPLPAHMRNRKLLLPAFHGQRVAQWGDQVRELVDTKLPELATGDPVAVRPWAQQLTLDVILRLVFGLSDPVRLAAFSAASFDLMSNTMLGLLFAPPAIRRDLGPRSPGGILSARRNALHRLIRQEIAERSGGTDASTRDDVLSVLIDARDEDGRGFTDGALCDELTGLVLAGHETTANALAWTLHLLAHNAGARDALVDDLDGGRDELLRAVIKESTRLRPPVLDAVRSAVRDTELGGHPIPQNAFISAMFCVTHHDPALWPDPSTFRPERHLAGEATPYALTPFGGGVRRCLGAPLAQLELEVGLRAILTDWVPEAVGRPERARLNGVTIIPARGGRIRLRHR